MNELVFSKLRLMQLLVFAAALSFIPTLFFYPIAEEGNYIISAMEMWQSGHFGLHTIYGSVYGRPPLIIWANGAMASILGWEYVTQAARLVAILSTLGCAGWVWWICSTYFKEKIFVWFAVLTFLTLGDLFFYRGWLAYADPLLTFFTFGSMTCLWIGVDQRKHIYLLASAILVSAGFMAKALTPYGFLGAFVLVLLHKSEYRRFLLTPMSLSIGLLTLATPIFWHYALSEQQVTSNTLFYDLREAFFPRGVGSYLKQISTFPLYMAISLAPVTLIALWAWLFKRKQMMAEPNAAHMRIILICLMLSLIPFWLATKSNPRYILPLYPFIAIVCARIVWRSSWQVQKVTFYAISFCILLKFLMGLVLWPYYQNHIRGLNYTTAAHALANQVGSFPLYSSDFRSVSLNVILEFDRNKFPRPLVTVPPQNWDDGFLLSQSLEPNSKLFTKLNVAFDDVYLLCRGSACLSPLILKSSY